MKEDSTVWSTIAWYQAFSSSVWAPGPRALGRSGASVPPGAADTTRMPCPAYSKARAAVTALTPPLAAAYGTRFTPLVATEPTLTIVPPPCSSRWGSTARQHHRVGNRERRISAWISSSLYSAYGLAQIVPPTLLIRMSIRPKRSRASAITRVQSAYCSRSPRTAIVSAPAELSLSLSSEASSDRSTSATRPPSLATPAATPSPIPCADPVTTAVLPSKRPAWITG